MDTPLEETGIEIYTPDEIINFKDGKVTLFEYQNPRKAQADNHRAGLRTLSVIFGYCMFSNMYKMRPFRTIFWSIPTLFLGIPNYFNYLSHKRTIVKINLHENGR